MSEWKPIETAPKDGTRIFVGAVGHVGTARWHEDMGKTLIADDRPYWEPFDHSYWSFDDEWEWFEPTHWMPLPSPPNA